MTGIAPSRDAYVRESLPLIGSILQQLDRDPTSKTAGCFDRQYWHYRTMDFPCGMSQEFVLPLALVWKHRFPENPYFQQERLREWVLAGIRFASRSAHKDGSCDDYYPFERALGAAVFSLYAMAEAYAVVEADDEGLLDFLARRARWVAKTGESGVLANHHAIAAAALAATGRITGDGTFHAAAHHKAEETLSYQHAEGWFQEYAGFDPGYQTVTVDFLARYNREAQDSKIAAALARAVDLLERVQHPDGTFGGEYAARNTYHTQPHGFELLAPTVPAAGRVADRFLRALEAGRRVRNDDDRLQGHHVYPYLMAWLDHQPRPEPSPPEPAPERTVLPGCGYLVDRRPGALLIAGLKKGGPFRLYRDNALIANDSGPVLVTKSGAVLVSHLTHDGVFTTDGNCVTTEVRFHRAKGELMTPRKLLQLRLFMLTVGRFARTLVRKLLQRRLITGKDPSPYNHRRVFHLDDHSWSVEDIIEKVATVKDPVQRVSLSVGRTSIYIAVSQPWDQGWLLPWTHLEELAGPLEAQGSAAHRRTWDVT